jgi:hypothetical protein
MNTRTHSHTPREQQALEAFGRHVAAFTSGNLDAVMNDFGEQAMVVTPDGVFEGPEKIRALYAGLLAEFGVIDRGDSPGLTLDALLVRHDTLFIAWHAESMRRVFPFGTDTFICNGDKFERQSIAFSSPQPRNGAVGCGQSGGPAFFVQRLAGGMGAD